MTYKGYDIMLIYLKISFQQYKLSSRNSQCFYNLFYDVQRYDIIIFIYDIQGYDIIKIPKIG
jgi:hypothetical protein